MSVGVMLCSIVAVYAIFLPKVLVVLGMVQPKSSALMGSTQATTVNADDSGSSAYQSTMVSELESEIEHLKAQLNDEDEK